MKLFFSILAVFFIALPPAYAGQSEEDCAKSATCRCQKLGICGKPHGYSNCLVTITAPTYSKKVTLDIFDESGRSRFADGARAKNSVNGHVTFKIGCAYLEKPTAQVYLCANAEGEAPGAVSVRSRSAGDLDRVVAERHLEMCLLGDKCERFRDGPPPKPGEVE